MVSVALHVSRKMRGVIPRRNGAQKRGMWAFETDGLQPAIEMRFVSDCVSDEIRH